MTRRLAALALLALALACSSGCALLPGGRPAGAPAEAEPPAPPVVDIDIDAPPELQTLLERYLDLSRLGTFARGQTVSDSELVRLIDATPAQVRELLQTEGYFAPQVTITREPAREAGAPERVLLKLQPGPRTVVTRVDIEVEGALARAVDAGDPAAMQTLEALRSRWSMPPGTPFRNPAWSDAKNVALAGLRSAGYAAATWSGTAADIDALGQRARLYAVADSGPLFLSGDVEIDGLRMHDRETVMHLADFGRGTPVTETLLLDFQERMLKAGLFERVSVSLDPDPTQADAARIIVRLAELPLHQVTTGLGYSTNNGPRATLESVYRRVLGYPATARNKFEWARRRRAWDGELSTHPGEDFYRNLVGGVIERLETDEDVVLSQRIRLGRSRESRRIDRFYFGEVERSERTTDVGRTVSVAYSLNYHLVWRSIDSLILPTEGLTMALQGAAGRAESGGDVKGNFARAYGRFTGYLPLGNNWNSQARIEVGNVFAPDQLTVPESLRFRAGGDESVRGYDFRSLGPVVNGAVDAGNALLTASFEVAHPILASMPTVWGAAFVDVGNASRSFKDFKAVVGSGVGVRWRSPVGPLRIDVAYAHELQSVRLHVGVGIVY